MEYAGDPEQATVGSQHASGGDSDGNFNAKLCHADCLVSDNVVTGQSRLKTRL